MAWMDMDRLAADSCVYRSHGGGEDGAVEADEASITLLNGL